MVIDGVFEGSGIELSFMGFIRELPPGKIVIEVPDRQKVILDLRIWEVWDYEDERADPKATATDLEQWESCVIKGVGPAGRCRLSQRPERRDGTPVNRAF